MSEPVDPVSKHLAGVLRAIDRDDAAAAIAHLDAARFGCEVQDLGVDVDAADAESARLALTPRLSLADARVVVLSRLMHSEPVGGV